MEKIWKIKPAGDVATVNKLSQELNIDKTLANMLVQRNVTTFEEARTFFRPELSDLHDPFLMKDMDKAVSRLEQAVANNQRIMIYGDYDVDGTTSVALVYSFIRERYDNIDFYIPDRYDEGYGISYKGIDYAQQSGVDLVIALDCGIKAVEKIEYAKQRNIDFIICDHHTPGDTIPDAVAVLDPKRADCNYPYKELSGCGVGFKFMQGYSLRNAIQFRNLEPYLDLVAISIASDIVPITGENRILSHFGLKVLNDNPRTGVKAILEVSGLTGKTLSISDCVFRIGPRINAAGRIQKAKRAVELLVAHQVSDAFEIAQKINDFNETRKNLDQNITQQALAMIAESEELRSKKYTILYNPEWHKGVIGIVASRLIENFYRPTIVLTKSNGFVTGSARSVVGFNVYDAIDHCSHLLENFGGHMYAAGLTLHEDKLQQFIDCFENYVEQNITEDQLIPQVDIDDVIAFEQITPKFFRILKQFEPFGPENMSPVFVSKSVADDGSSRIVGRNKEHLKLGFRDENNYYFSGIGFNLSHAYPLLLNGNTVDVCYSIDENDFRGNISMQLRVKDIKTATTVTPNTQ